MKKLLTAAVVALSFAGTVSADPIFIDNGVDYGSNDSTQTGWFDRLDFAYTSQSTLTDANNDALINAGDTIVTQGGMALGKTAGNIVSGDGTIAQSLFGLGYNDANGFWSGTGMAAQGQWGLTFGFENVQGILTDGGFQYDSGTINFYAFDAAAVIAADQATGGDTDISGSLTHLFDLNILAGTDTGNSTVFMGDITVFGADTFNIAYGNDSRTFTEASLLPGGLRFETSNDTVGEIDGSYDDNGTLVLATANHVARATFSVPEPTSIAILGLGLLGFAGARRRKS